MNPNPDSQPGIPFQKPNGRWTFYLYPDGSRHEAGEYADEATVKDAFVTALRVWEANQGKQNGPVRVITK